MSEPASEKMFQTSPLPRQPQVPRQRRDARALYQIPARLCASAGGLRPGGRPDDVMSDLSAARTATRSGQCRESRARRTHEFARSAGRAARQEPTTPDCQTQRYADIQRTTKLSFNLSKFRLLWQTANQIPSSHLHPSSYLLSHPCTNAHNQKPLPSGTLLSKDSF